MNITYKNIGTEFEKFDLYLEEKDYIKLFKEEIAFGKLLKIYSELAKIISEDPAKLREWVLGISRYEDVLKMSQKICEELGENNK